MVFKLIDQTYLVFGTDCFALLLLPWIDIGLVTGAHYAATTQSGGDKLSMVGYKTVSFMATLSWNNIRNQLFQPTLWLDVVQLHWILYKHQ